LNNIASIKLNTGETVFAQIMEVTDTDLVAFMPFSANLVNMKNQINLALRPYDVFTDNKLITFTKNSIVSIAPLAKEHTKMLSDVTLATEFNEVKDRLLKQIDVSPILESDFLDGCLSDILRIYMRHGMTFKKHIPPLDAVKDDFYQYVLQQQKELPIKH
jgi:hypothetical protein